MTLTEETMTNPTPKADAAKVDAPKEAKQDDEAQDLGYDAGDLSYVDPAKGDPIERPSVTGPDGNRGAAKRVAQADNKSVSASETK
jgi:hypothetical protein